MKFVFYFINLCVFFIFLVKLIYLLYYHSFKY